MIAVIVMELTVPNGKETAQSKQTRNLIQNGNHPFIISRKNIYLSDPLYPYYFQLVSSLLDGSKKTLLSHWWLDLIETKVVRF